MTNLCPYCGTQNYVSKPLIEHLKTFDWINCGNCGLFLKVTLDKTRTDIISLEKHTSAFYFGLIFSSRLKTAYPYSEPPMSDSDCQKVKQIVAGIRVNTIQDRANFNAKVFKDENAKNWVINNVMPMLTPIYAQYPLQVTKIIEGFGFGPLLAPYVIQCDYCGLTIPQARKNNCPICLNGKIPPPPYMI